MSILKRLADYDEGRIVSFEVSSDKTTIDLNEECDNYFTVTLTKAEFGQMIEELKALYDSMSDGDNSTE